MQLALQLAHLRMSSRVLLLLKLQVCLQQQLLWQMLQRQVLQVTAHSITIGCSLLQFHNTELGSLLVL